MFIKGHLDKRKMALLYTELDSSPKITEVLLLSQLS